MTTSRKPFQLNFERPPIVEMVCGVAFEELDLLLTPHFGGLWEKFRDSYPHCEERTPLIFEELDNSAFTLSEIPPLPRIWFLNEDKSRIIQIQRSWFIHNWRRTETADEYPRFHAVIDAFRDYFSTFEDFLATENLGSINPVFCELAYINAIPMENGWSSLSDIGKVFPDFVWRGNSNRFLTEPQSVNWKMVFDLPEDAGNLSVSVRSVVRSGTTESVLLMELVAQGIQQDRSLNGLLKWFDLAHNFINCSFADLTSPEIQKTAWRKRNE